MEDPPEFNSSLLPFCNRLIEKLCIWYIHDSSIRRTAFIKNYMRYNISVCNQRAQTDGFAEQNGRDAERADLTCRY